LDVVSDTVSRRSFLSGIAASAGALAFSGCGLTGRGLRVRGRERPNIVLIMADDIGVEGFSCYGGTSYETPVIDGLAREGVMFTQCHSQPLCTPSRVKLMTGMSNIRNYSNFSILNPEERTFGHMLQQAGYRTAVAGKWQLYGAEHYKELAGAGTLPADAGFDEHCLWQVGELGPRYWDPRIVRNNEFIENTEGRYGPDLFCDFMLDFMERSADEPFFIYYPMALVHNPFDPTPESEDRECADKNLNFADMVAYMDSVVGRIIRGLDRLGLRENTLVLFTGDNGTHKNISSMMGELKVKGGKGSTTDAGTHVPLIASRPGHTPRGAVCDDLIDFSDFTPTLADAAGVLPPEGAKLDGQSFLPQITGKPGDPREWIFCFYHPRPKREETEAKRFARNKRWKLYGDGNLFDLRTDPFEENPIPANSRDTDAARARRALQAAIDSYPAEPLKIR